MNAQADQLDVHVHLAVQHIRRRAQQLADQIASWTPRPLSSGARRRAS